jgi:hypothetical protein
MKKYDFPVCQKYGKGEILRYFHFSRITGGMKKTRYFHSRLTGGEIPSYGGDFFLPPLRSSREKRCKGALGRPLQIFFPSVTKKKFPAGKTNESLKTKEGNKRAFFEKNGVFPLDEDPGRHASGKTDFGTKRQAGSVRG